MPPSKPRPILVRALASVLLIGLVIIAGFGLASWKSKARSAAAQAAASQPEFVESVSAVTAVERTHVRTATAIGTVHALRSITLSNELPGTVREVALVSGAIVEEGVLLVALDVSVEVAELQAHQAEARQAELLLGRTETALVSSGASAADVDRARAAFQVASADVARLEALIARKSIKAPFRAQVGLADVHPGQYLEAGTPLTTLQGVDDAVHVDFAVAQDVAATVAVGDEVSILLDGMQPIAAPLVALDARVDATTRTTTLRALLKGVPRLPAPGASVRVHVPIGAPITAAAVPVTALRRGPQGEHVFVLTPDAEGVLRAMERRVTVGPVLGDEVLVLEHLAVGEQVATSGSFKLRQGARVQIIAPQNEAR